MTCIIVVACDKGGVGKSTIADEIAFGLERKGFQVGFSNLDNQGGTLHDSTLPNQDDDYLIVDAPARSGRDFLQYCKNADVLLIPTGASMRDMVCMTRCWEIARENMRRNTHLAVVANRYDGRRIADRDFDRFCKNADMPVWGRIPTATAFARAASQGISVVEYEKTNPASNAIEELVSRIVYYTKEA